LIGETVFFSNVAAVNGGDIYIDNNGSDTASTVTCAVSGVVFCSGVDGRTIFEGVPDSTNCDAAGVDGSTGEEEMCSMNLD
jgi:hypothetical protein